MRHSILSILTMLCIGCGLKIHATEENKEDTGIYINSFGGFNFLDLSTSEDLFLIDVKTGYAVGASIGYKFSRTMRLEGEFAYRENQFERFIFFIDQETYKIPVEGQFTKWTCMANIFFDMPFNWFLVPYFGGGIGARRDSGVMQCAHLSDEVEAHKLEFKESGLTYQGIIGLNFQHFKKTDFRFEYRILNSPENGDNNQTLALTLQRTF